LPGDGLGDPPDVFSKHTNITRLYLRSLNSPNDQDKYILDNYLGANRSAQSTLGTGSQVVDDASSGFASSTYSVSVSEIDTSTFFGGNFDQLGTSWLQLTSPEVSAVDSVLLHAWIATLESPTSLLTAGWDLQGNVALIPALEDSDVELRGDGASIAQQVFLPTHANLLQLDLSVLQASVGDLLEVIVDQSVIQTIDLSSFQSTGLQAISLGRYDGRLHQVGVRLISLVEEAIVRVDSLSIEPVPPGDYDLSGYVDHADYDTWKSQFGIELFAGTGADGNCDGIVNAADYTVWRNNLGTGTPPQGSGSAVIAGVGGSAGLSSVTVVDEQESLPPAVESASVDAPADDVAISLDTTFQFSTPDDSVLFTRPTRGAIIRPLTVQPDNLLLSLRLRELGFERLDESTMEVTSADGPDEWDLDNPFDGTSLEAAFADFREV
jgi:hypothetical protein